MEHHATLQINKKNTFQRHASQPFQMQIHADLKQAEQDEQPPAITINGQTL